ncbi:MAG: hypothetical protein ACREFP_00230 [Acetobacteraceae bacterium]
MADQSQAWELAPLLAQLVDELIPGGGSWPSASAVGAHGVLAERLLDLEGDDAVQKLAEVLGRCGGPLDGRSAEERVAITARFEREHPRRFAIVRNAVYLAYYESPAVIATLRTLGHRYHSRPHITGYAEPPFDVTRDTPRHRRGSHVATAEVRRVDLRAIPGAAEWRSAHDRP